MNVSRILCCSVVVFEIIFTILFFAFAGRFLDLSAASPSQADLVVVLGSSIMVDRLKVGSDLYNAKIAKNLLVTGFSSRPDQGQVMSLASDWRVRYLVQMGVPESVIYCDSDAKSTWMEVDVIRQLLERKGWKTVVMVSDPPHFRRISWVLEKKFEGTDLTYFLVSSNPRWWNKGRWWENSTSASFVVLEFIKLIYYNLKYFDE